MSAPGASGRPYYYCPYADDDWCLGTETPWVYGVQAGWNAANNRNMGPKVPYFRQTALNFTD